MMDYTMFQKVVKMQIRCLSYNRTKLDETQ